MEAGRPVVWVIKRWSGSTGGASLALLCRFAIFRQHPLPSRTMVDKTGLWTTELQLAPNENDLCRQAQLLGLDAKTGSDYVASCLFDFRCVAHKVSQNDKFILTALYAWSGNRGPSRKVPTIARDSPDHEANRLLLLETQIRGGVALRFVP